MSTITDPAFTGTDDAHETITEFTRFALGGGVPASLDFNHTSMRIARMQWDDEREGDIYEPNEACDLAGWLFIEPIRDRIMADTINATDDAGTYQQVLAGRYEGQPDWSRVDATEKLLFKILTYTPTEDRAPLYYFLGFLSWYRGQAPLAAEYVDKALKVDPGHRISIAFAH
ncbi:DUF4192 family protein (plasmid) [Arthrobacter agilis]|uniref:DUF4192 family protein n=1 Tax=Arthrobacter agilis TaxID=37921 RepID=UPI0023656DEB|nr:DUF4192 family protein [Arthrobacter agilis]WDF35196.1 DUF4192 family protein [Arthrobacter agilis]